MPLDDLVSVIETLQQRIRDHGDTLRQNEYRTRMALIDPLLTALGWDVADPGLVIGEYQVGNGRADYALLGVDGRPRAFGEAKHLGEPLETGRHEAQIFTYALLQQVRYAGLTDGNKWVLDNVAEFSGGERRLLELSITNEPAYQCALKFLLLWHPNLSSGQPMAASEPVFGVEVPIFGSSATQLHKGQRTTSTLPAEGWTSLSTFEAVPGTTPPPSVLFDSGEERNVDYWKTLLVEVAEWLVRKGTLTANCCPVSSPSDPSVHLVHVTPEHADGTRIYNPRRLTNGLFLASHGSARALVRRCKQVIESLGEDPGSVWLKVE